MPTRNRFFPRRWMRIPHSAQSLFVCSTASAGAEFGVSRSASRAPWAQTGMADLTPEHPEQPNDAENRHWVTTLFIRYLPVRRRHPPSRIVAKCQLAPWQ